MLTTKDTKNIELLRSKSEWFQVFRMYAVEPGGSEENIDRHFVELRYEGSGLMDFFFDLHDIVFTVVIMHQRYASHRLSSLFSSSRRRDASGSPYLLR